MARAGGHLIAFVAAVLATSLVACGVGEEPRSPLCTSAAGAVERALGRAPRPVHLADGSLISDCVARSRSDAELQEIGLVLTRAADHLAARAARDEAAVLALGYLVGAARRGAAQTSGVHVQLVRRLEQGAAFLESRNARLRAALRRGIAAGQATG
jgi:hypothetical protein